jgi:ElaB/YqjD/DUF883 family membrane-anchored ribosome-binding protein
MGETTMSAAFKDAADKLHDQVAALGDEAERRIRRHAPRAREALNEGYDETVRAARALGRNRAVQGWVIAGALGLVIGLVLFRRS